MVTDRGNFVSGQLIYDEQQVPLGLVGVKIEPIQNSKGAELPRAFVRDAEALAVIERDGAPAAVRVGFENLTRVADFALVDAMPTGAAREVTIPGWLTDTRTNESLEAVCIAPAASPIAGSTLLLTEGVIDDDGQHSAWLLGQNDKGPLSYLSSEGTNPTDCAFLPNGDLLVLERGVAFLTFNMKLKRVPAAEVKPGSPHAGRGAAGGHRPRRRQHGGGGRPRRPGRHHAHHAGLGQQLQRVGAQPAAGVLAAGMSSGATALCSSRRVSNSLRRTGSVSVSSFLTKAAIFAVRTNSVRAARVAWSGMATPLESVWRRTMHQARKSGTSPPLIRKGRRSSSIASRAAA